MYLCGVFIMRLISQISLSLILIGTLWAQQPLDGYIKTGLKNNLALKQKQLDYEKALRALDKARGMFYPSLGLDARYSRAGGGRIIDFPLGDLVNPVYTSLNQIFSALGQPARNFPVLKNQQIPFLRKREHETKLRLIQPLFQPVIFYNAQIREHQLLAQKAALNSYKNILIRDICLAWYGCLQARRAVTIYDNAEKVMAENISVNRSLLKNGVLTRDALLQAQAEQAQLHQQKQMAVNRRETAKAYLNFLLNRPADSPIQWADTLDLSTAGMVDRQALKQCAIKNRFEFLQIAEGIGAQKSLAQLKTSRYWPTLNLVADYGYQGETYRFGPRDDYWMGSLLLQWNFYNGGQDKAERQMAQIGLEQLRLREQELTRQIELDVDNQFRRLVYLQQALIAARQQAKASRQAFDLIRKKYNAGQLPLIRFMDAREKQTRAALNQQVTRIELKKQQVRLAAATGSLLKNYSKKEK